MKIIFNILFCSLSFIFYSQNLKIKLYNKTGYEIKNLTFERKALGNLKNNGSVSLTLDSLEFYKSSQVPFNCPVGKIDKIKLEVLNMMTLAEYFEVKKEGEYEFDIFIDTQTYENSKSKDRFLNLKIHQAK